MNYEYEQELFGGYNYMYNNRNLSKYSKGNSNNTILANDIFKNYILFEDRMEKIMKKRMTTAVVKLILSYLSYDKITIGETPYYKEQYEKDNQEIKDEQFVNAFEILNAHKMVLKKYFRDDVADLIFSYMPPLYTNINEYRKYIALYGNKNKPRKTNICRGVEKLSIRIDLL